MFEREELAIDPVDAARMLLGSVLRTDQVAVRIVETEAYRGADDPASHSYRGKTKRNAVMWGPAGHLYVYFTYGMHFCANVVTMTEGEAGAVLLRAGEVIEGEELARKRRPAAKRDRDLASGPAKLTSALGLDTEANGVDLLRSSSPVRLERGDDGDAFTIDSGPRVGISVAQTLPWRFWIEGKPQVSTFRAGGKRSGRR
ncbi:DNA-3-methyladenine glycosylase [Sciscionella sediminilitoris]|uniref:DNA-3-methyladenine glycosylase n=1 Tax=Sciscionella sediminilitoris TaxID=1445613 RepID=UPI0004DEDAD5|nr:DNA-3-methyladenine glycosylase [Sciscionella sp. SE31]